VVGLGVERHVDLESHVRAGVPEPAGEKSTFSLLAIRSEAKLSRSECSLPAVAPSPAFLSAARKPALPRRRGSPGLVNALDSVICLRT
jgi:hypothetical protein